VHWWDTIDQQVQGMFGDAREGLVGCVVLMGAGVMSTVRVMVVDHQYHVLSGRCIVGVGMKFGQGIASAKLGCNMWPHAGG